MYVLNTQGQWVENGQAPIGQYPQSQQPPQPSPTQQFQQQPPAPYSPSGTPNPPAGDAKDQEIQRLKDELQKQETFVNDASVMVTAITQNPQLKQQVSDAIRGVQSPPPQQQPPPQPPAPAAPPAGTPPPAPPPTDPRVDSLDVTARDNVVTMIEGKYGFSNLKPEEKKALRQNVEKRLNMWNTSIFKAQVHQLPKLLEDAYLLENLPQAQEQNKVQALVENYTNDMGAFPTMQTQQQPQDGAQITPDQRHWAQKLGVSEDKVAANIKEISNTGVVSYKPPVAQQPQYQQAPSGTPPAPQPGVHPVQPPVGQEPPAAPQS